MDRKATVVIHSPFGTVVLECQEMELKSLMDNAQRRDIVLALGDVKIVEVSRSPRPQEATL